MTKAEKTTKREASGTCSGLPERTRLSREQIERKKATRMNKVESAPLGKGTRKNKFEQHSGWKDMEGLIK